MSTISTQPTTDLPVCTSMQDIQETTTQYAHLQDLKAYIMHGWLHRKDDVTQDIQKYWPIRHEVAMIDGMAIQGKKMIPS